MKRLFSIHRAARLQMTPAELSKCPEVVAAEDGSGWQPKYARGLRSLSEGKYEEGILALTALSALLLLLFLERGGIL